MTAEQLEALSQKATQGKWEPGLNGDCFVDGEGQIFDTDGLGHTDAAFIIALVNAYRTGQLILVDQSVVERVARRLAPMLEGGREFDQMPKDRRELKIWNRGGMCCINDATQDDALEAATAAISAMGVNP